MSLKHLAIIMDGNRRFAKFLGEDSTKGHIYGEKKLRNVLQWCKEEQIKELTVYALSLQNLSRPKKEFDFLINTFKSIIKQELNNDQNNIKIKFIGRKEVLDKDLVKDMNALENKTKNNKPYKLNIAMAYGGKEEIFDGIKKIDDIKNLTLETFEKNYLQLSSSPDLVIRTGKEKRLSNFLLWQIAYSELIFLDKYWPDFTKKDFKNCVLEFKNRERRMGL